jgi:hypothetical protein
MDEYRFKIDAYTPDSLPMARLAEYMADLAALLGNVESVHFSRLETGSTVLVHKVEEEAVPKVSARLGALRRGEPDTDVERAYRSLDKRLAEDNAVGELRVSGSVVRFLGRDAPKPIQYGSVSESGSLDGVLVSVGGKDKFAHVILADRDRTFSNIDVSRELARELASHLYGGPLRLHGVGRWQRTEEGEWQLQRFRASTFEVLGDSALEDVVESLQGVKGGWSDVEDPFAYLSELRDGPTH